jgi:23S rRNA (guanine745-N1)-methyltransferase
VPDLLPAAVDVLACPACGQGLHVTGAALRCAQGHSFDRARQGHVTLLPSAGSPHAGDSAQMVADRADFLAAGHYAGVTAALAEAVLAGGVPRTVLDAGGGTGAHLAGVLDRAPGAVGVGLDVSRYAARRAARAHPRAIAVVADTWSRWPVRSAAVDRVLVVFAPRNGPETARVLAPEGRLVVVTPAADHLAELIGPLGLLHVDPDKAGRLAATLEPHLRPMAATAVREELVLDHPAVRTLVGMGPHARHRTADELAAAIGRLPAAVRVTVSVDVATYAPG